MCTYNCKKHTELSERLCAPLGALRHVERDAGAGDEALLDVGVRGGPSGAEKRGQRRQPERKRKLIARAPRRHECRTRMRCGSTSGTASGSAARRRVVAAPARSAHRQRPRSLRTRREHLHASACVGARLPEYVQPAARLLVAHDLAARLL